LSAKIRKHPAKLHCIYGQKLAPGPQRHFKSPTGKCYLILLTRLTSCACSSLTTLKKVGLRCHS